MSVPVIKRPTGGRKRRQVNKKRPVTAEDLLTLPFVHGGEVAPDGSAYVFYVRKARPDHKGYHSHLYVVDSASGETRRYTSGNKSDVNPIFSPDASLIAFCSKRGKLPGIFLIPTDGGEAYPLVEKDGSFDSLSFSPDGKEILCTFRPNDPAAEFQTEADKTASSRKKSSADDKPAEGKGEPPVCRHINRLFYRLDGLGFQPKAEAQIWLYNIASGEGRQITKVKNGARTPAFSPTGRQIAFVSNSRPDPDRELDWLDLYVVSASGGKPRLIPTPPGPVSQPAFSPDGKQIAYLGHDDLDRPWYENIRLWVVSADGRSQARNLCPNFDQPAYDATITDSGGGRGMVRPRWSPNGKSIFFFSSARGSSGLYRVRASGGKPVMITPNRIHLRDCDLTANCRLALGVVSTATRPAEVHAIDIPSGRLRRLTRLTKSWCDAIEIQTPKHLRIKSTEQTVYDAWLLTPPKFSPRKKYPAIIEVHGGPMTQYGYSFFLEMQLLAAKGYVVFYGNPRGSLGYGRDFAEAIYGDWGNRDFADVMAGADYLADLPFVDERRLGITGGSYGGYMTNWAVGHTRRFKAAVTQRSVVDLVPFFGSSDIGFFFYQAFGAHPWEDRAGYRRQSPLTYVKNIRTPLLIIHAENDLRCNIEQAGNLYTTLKTLGRRTELVSFPGESHGLSRGGRPDRRVVRLQKILEWFERYL